MNHFLHFYCLIAFLFYANCEKSFRVASFNLWQFGKHVENGFEKILKHIKIIDADVFSLQEVQNVTIMERLVDELGEPWTAVFPNLPYPNIGILTKQKVIPSSVENTTVGVHARIQFPQGFSINFWAYHGWHKSYGPHAAFNRLVTNLSQIIAGEFAPKEKGTGRAQNILEVLESKSMKRDLKDLEEIPMFILGDFNSPSHQDWIEETKHLHSDWIVPWPSTKQLTDDGFIDSYRELYPDPVKQPGYTWSPVAKTNYEWDFVFPDPQDRIDFVFYKGKVKPEKIELYAGKESLKMMPDHFYNDYPSDHYAVIADFVFRKSESKKKE